MGDVREDQLVARVLQGEREAYAELVGRLQGMVASVAWRYGVPADEIEDVVSEVFLKAYQNLGRYRPEFPFSTWLYRVAVNHVLDRARRARREQTRRALPDELADCRPSTQRDLEERERVQALREALGRLAPHHREAIFLVYIEGMKLEAAARLLGVPVGTVKTRLMRGREALRRWLEREYPELFGEVS